MPSITCECGSVFKTPHMYKSHVGNRKFHVFSDEKLIQLCADADKLFAPQQDRVIEQQVPSPMNANDMEYHHMEPPVVQQMIDQFDPLPAALIRIQTVTPDSWQQYVDIVKQMQHMIPALRSKLYEIQECDLNVIWVEKALSIIRFEKIVTMQNLWTTQRYVKDLTGSN